MPLRGGSAAGRVGGKRYPAKNGSMRAHPLRAGAPRSTSAKSPPRRKAVSPGLIYVKLSNHFGNEVQKVFSI